MCNAECGGRKAILAGKQGKGRERVHEDVPETRTEVAIEGGNGALGY